MKLFRRQLNNNQGQTPARRLVLLISIILIVGFTAVPRPAKALIPIIEKLSIPTVLQTIGDKLQFVWEKGEKALEKIEKGSAAVAFRKGVEYFVNRIAQDTAIWIASGAKGQGPLFFSQGWGEYLSEVADGAAGAILDDLTKASTTVTQQGRGCVCDDGTTNNASEDECSAEDESRQALGLPGCHFEGPTTVTQEGGMLEGFNICRPDLDVQLRINLGLSPTPIGRPKCRFSVLKRNWEREITRASFLPDFQRTFNPEESDLGAALSLHTNLLAETERKRMEAVLLRVEGGGFQAVSEGVSGRIITPGQATKGIFEQTLGTILPSQLEDTGSILGNAISVFTNTLAKSFLNNLIKNGLGQFGGSGGRRQAGNVVLTNPEAQFRAEGVEAARIRLAKDVTPNFTTPGRYDVLAMLVSCPNPSKHGPNDCAITDNMRNAISQKMTLKEAIDKGLFNGTGPFGFTSWDPEPIEPSITDGVPYRSILLMRKYRIVPVGWELAAKYIQYFDKKPHSLSELIKTGGCADGGVYDCNTSPFYHFIDPNWVLAAPDAYCKLQGPGPEILSSQVSQGSDLNKDGKFDGPDEEPPTVQVTRNDNYCADEQTCIQKDAKGVCKFYGYCTEEKKTWNFGENSCNPTFNTCATLANKTSGETVSYLLNTVNFDTCDAKSVGCQQYSRWKNLPPPPAPENEWSVTPDANSIHLNAKAATCDQTNAGCRAYISTSNITSLAGANLVQNPSFEGVGANNKPIGWTDVPGVMRGSLTIGAGDAVDGSNYYTFGQNVPLGGNDVIQSSVLLIDTIIDRTFTISFSARGTGDISATVQSETPFLSPSNTLSANWQRYTATVTIPDNVPINGSVNIVISAPENSSVDAVKLEIGNQATPYSDYYPYALGQRVHLKRAPDYLTCGTNVKASDTPDPNADKQECQPYARFCTAAEAGCTRYTPTLGGAPITSVRGDACPAECVGYDTYTQSKTFFESSAFKDLIPKTAKQCSAAAVGCDEFTNLDIEKQGGEAKEYYQQLRFCQKPAGGADEGVFYTWEGSDTTGFQLKVFQLKISDDDPTAPCTNLSWTGANSAQCDDQTRPPATCTLADLGVNPDCRQFYDPNGNISYRLLSRTISISNDCHPYRKTSATQTDCTANSGFWDTATSACIYQAIPKEGRRCSAAAAGCREYRGGTSANYQVIFKDTFEANVGGWTGGSLSPVASTVGGHSYQAPEPTGTIRKDLSVMTGSIRSGDIKLNAQYILSFWARQQSGGIRSVTAQAGGKNFNPPGVWQLTDQWQFFQSDPVTFDSDQNVTLVITIGAGASFYIDNIELKSNINTYYLIKNSGNTPASCLVPEQMLGCQTFRDNKNQTRNVWRFGDACHEKVVGCEAVIDTQNTTKGADAPFEQTFDLDEVGDNELKIPADTIDYLVNDKAKQCGAEAQGCEALGVPIYASPSDNAPITGWEKSPAYRLNNPDKYTDTLCRSEQRACMAYTTSKNTEIYFKDPGNFTCNYLTNRPQAGWYHNVCNSTDPNVNGDFCVTAADCKKDDGTLAIGASCNTPPASVGPNCETPAPTQPRTLVAAGVHEPTDGWVGACPAEQNSCTEFIDPRSDSSPNLIYNGAFVLNVDNNTVPDGWSGSTTNYDSSKPNEGVHLITGQSLTQDVNIQGLRSYVISAETVNDTDLSTVSARLYGCLNSNNIISPDGSAIVTTFGFGGYGAVTLSTPASNDRSKPYQRFGGQFYITKEGSFKCKIEIGPASTLVPAGVVQSPILDSTGNWFRNISLREAAISYQFADRVDRTGCNGLVDNNTCVLFNERSVSSDRSVRMDAMSYRGVGFDADTSPESPTSKIPNSKMDTNKPEFGTCQPDGKCSNISSRSCTINQDCALPFDSNALIKVTPDRQCAAWLSCRTARTITTGGVTKKVCLDVQSCEAVDDNGNCTSQVLADAKDKDLTFSAANVDLIQNRSGFSRVGFDWGGVCIAGKIGNACTTDAACDTSLGPPPSNDGRCQPRIIQGYMSPAQMPQVGENLPIVNGDFESASKSGNPSGWFGWQNGENFRVISNPVEAQKAGVRYPLEGRNFLEVNANHAVPLVGKCSNPPNNSCAPATENIDCGAGNSCTNLQPAANISGFIPVSSDTEYVISAYLNTLHFTGKSAEVRVYEYDDQRRAYDPVSGVGPKVPIPEGGFGQYNAALNLGPGFDWSLMSDRFTTVADDPNTANLDEGTHFIRLQFAWDPEAASSSGLWYVDDTKIQPALEYQRNEPFPPALRGSLPDFGYKPYERGLQTIDYAYAPQSCRLYPEADALSCSYHDDKGLRHKGKLGYCLEWDPQNSNYCLQWWPVDTVIGEDTGEDTAGYSDRAPLYYCLNTISTDTWLPLITAGDPRNGTVPPFFANGGAGPAGGGGACGGVGLFAIPPGAGSQIVFKIAQSGNVNLGFGPTVGLTDIPGACDELTGGAGCEIRVHARDLGGGDNGTFYRLQVGVEDKSGNIAWEDVQPEKNCAGSCCDNKMLYYDLKNLTSSKTEKHYSHLRITTSDQTHFTNFEEASVRPTFGCTAVAQVVTPTGENRSWASRLLPNSSYEVQDLKYKYSADYPPFGGAVPPEPVEDPTIWDGSGLLGVQPVPVEEAITTDSELPAPYQVRAGRPYSCQPWPSASQCGTPFDSPPVRTIDDGINRLKMLFIQSYGVWQWNSTSQQYSLTNKTWNAPIRDSIKDERCDSTPATPAKDNIRPPMTDPSSFCAVTPQVPKIWVNNQESGNVDVSRTGAVTVSFTAIADADQLPITQYIIDWGDGTQTKQTALRLQSRPTQQNAITLVHVYDYPTLKKCDSDSSCAAQSVINCIGNECTTRPRVQITDNWNWCNGNYGGVTDPNNPFKDKDGYYGPQCQTDPAAWRVSNATVTVSE